MHIGGREEVTTVVMIDGPDEKLLPGIDGYLGLGPFHARRIEFDLRAMVLVCAELAIDPIGIGGNSLTNPSK